jgi:hypothetical protein
MAKIYVYVTCYDSCVCFHAWCRHGMTYELDNEQVRTVCIKIVVLDWVSLVCVDAVTRHSVSDS